MLIQAFWVIGILSSLFKYIVLYKFCEHTFIAVSVGIVVTMAVQTIRNNALAPLIAGDVFLLIPILLGLIVITRISRKYGYLSRISMATMIGATMGSTIRVTVQNNIIGQILPIIKDPIITSDILTTLNNSFVWVGMICGFTYFLFTTKNLPRAAKRPYEIMSQIGRYVIIAMIGASFANTALGRQSVFLERIHFLLQVFGLAN